MDNLRNRWQQKYEALRVEEANSYEKLRQENARMHQQLVEILTALAPNSQSVNDPLMVERYQENSETVKRHEFMTQKNTHRYEGPLELLRGRHVPAREQMVTAQAPIEGKELISTSAEKKVGSLIHFETHQSAAVKGLEQKHETSLQIEVNRMCKVKLSDSPSKPEELLKLLAAQPPLLKPAYRALNAYTAPAEMGTTAEAAEDMAPNSKESIDHTFIEGDATRGQMKMQGTSKGHRDEYITGQQCKDGSLRMLPTQKRDEISAESEAAEEERCEPQGVEYGNVYEATSKKESGNQTQLILIDDRNLHSFIDFRIATPTKVESTTVAPLLVTVDHGHKVRNKNSCSQFVRKEQGHKFFADSRDLRLKSLDTARGIDEMQEYKQVPFDPGPNKVTFHSVEGVDRVLETDWVKIYKIALFGPEQNHVTIHSIEGASHMPNITKELPMVIKHRAQLLAAQPYRIKSGATVKEMHSCMQTPFRGYEQCFELPQISDQHEVEMAVM